MDLKGVELLVGLTRDWNREPTALERGGVRLRSWLLTAGENFGRQITDWSRLHESDEGGSSDFWNGDGAALRCFLR